MMDHKKIRKIHYWATFLVMVPLFIMTVSGIMLMFKKQSSWIQPPTIRGTAKTPTLFFETMLDSLKAVPDVTVESWDDIKRVDVRPSKGMAKVQLANQIEVQIDIASGKILQVATRRSDILEDIHTGAYFGDFVKYGIFLTASIIFFIMLLTGIYLFIRPIYMKQKRKKILLEEALSVE